MCLEYNALKMRIPVGANIMAVALRDSGVNSIAVALRDQMIAAGWRDVQLANPFYILESDVPL